ncbi:hypothetical protein ACFOTA_06940 [Chitinophaga sp. GCM10012297]|uniref:Hemolysin XhlA n=1 Tax=Chitinophaga chungangae TaxID=2821488 RepID=A0ABS3YB96_9BACT|nr:hypothetical protein [Chitinophaga chungangae]MBO9151935.1 hypothetical protein [Chitinophaga chungangae]
MTTEAQISRMQENYEKLAEDVSEVKDDLREVKGMLHRVTEAVGGNPVSGDGGMVARINKLEKKVEMFERLKWLIIGAAAASGLALGEIIDKILR